MIPRQTESKEIRELALQIESQLQRIRRCLRKQLEAEYAKGALTGPQRLVMELLVSSRGRSVKEISEHVNLTHSTVSGIVDRLESKGLVERKPFAGDRRMTLMTPSREVRMFMEDRTPNLKFNPLLIALEQATPSERRAVQSNIETLSRLLHER